MRPAAITTLCLALLGCSGAVVSEAAVKSAGDDAHTIATQSFGGFKILAEQPVNPGGKSDSFLVTLREGHCYRILGVRAGGPGEEDVELGLRHSSELLEVGTDVFDVTPKDVNHTIYSMWGTCVWPAFAGEVRIFHNLKETGGYVLVLEARADQLSWKLGEDVKLYLSGTGAIDLEMVEKQDAETRIAQIFAQDQQTLPPELFGKLPFYNDMVGTLKPMWKGSFTVSPDTCYHFFLASINCSPQYEISNMKSGKTINDDGVPGEVHRSGWSHDFCPVKKNYNKDAEIKVQLESRSREYEKCWFGVALYMYELSKKQKKKLLVTTRKERKQALAEVKPCQAELEGCQEACQEVEDKSCMEDCASLFDACASNVVFQGEIK